MKIRKTVRIQLGFVAGFLFLWRADPSPASFLAGLVLMLLGESIRFVSAGTLIKFEGVTRNGIYAFTRNPLYLGSFLIGLGACIVGRDPYFALLFILLFPPIYFQVIKGEEAHLIERYGDDYRAYLEEVPRFIPRRFELGEILRETSPFLAVKNRELLTLAGMLAVLAVMAVKLGIA
jgi:protein-S-isoprenylcysteine O-methyltransferase Ste14